MSKSKTDKNTKVAPLHPLWGVTLKEACKRSDTENWCIPLPIKVAIEYIESQERFLSSEGIYRIPGSLLKVQAFRERFDRGEEVKLGVAVPWEVDEATSLIINFLKNMTDSLFGTLKDALKAAVAQSDLGLMSKLLGSLPLENRETLRLLTKHLAKVAQYKDKNKMDTRNLSLCFGPSFAVIFPPLIENCDNIIPETMVFGVPLAVAAKRSDPLGLIPSPLKVSMDFIERYGLTENQIYKESGSFQKTKEYRYLFNSGLPVNYELKDIHCATGIISTFFRDCPDSLWNDLKEKFLVIASDQLLDDGAKISNLKNLVQHLPPVNYAIVKAFSEHLSRVASSKTNSMNAEQLAQCLGPSYGVIFPSLILFVDKIFQ